MAENKVPVLLVGLGGIGGSIVDMIMQKLPRSKKDYVGAVAIDTNLEDLKKLEYCEDIWIGEDGLVKDILNRYPEYMTWFPSNSFINNRGIKEGAGQIRAISRLAIASSSRSDRNVLITLNQEIDKVLQHSGEVDVSKFNVFVTGSITGGTGAGSFLQIPFYIKDYVKKTMSNTTVSIRGLFVNADVTADCQPSRINRDAVKVNAYACLKELNAIYLTQVQDNPENRLDLEFYHFKEWLKDFEKAAKKLRMQADLGKKTEEEFRRLVIEMIGEGSNIPYQAFYIAEKSDNMGTIGGASLDTVKTQLANIIFAILFTPVRPIAAGINDNGILLDMECSGMNRYSSAGLCTIRYPYEQMKEYVALSFCKKLIGEEWLLLDMLSGLQKKDAMARQKSDPSVQIPKIEETYVQLFETQSEGGEGTRLGHLKKEAFIVNENSTDASVCKVDDYLDAIDDAIEEILKDSTLKAAEKGCEISAQNMRELDSAASEVLKKTEAAELYAVAMKNLVKKRQYEVANEVFPESFDSMIMGKDSPLSAYSLLGNVHPIAARYLCYRVVIAIKEKLEDLGTGVKESALSAFKKIDYDAKKENVQSAAEVLNSARDEKMFFIIPNSKKTVQAVTSQFQQNLTNHIMQTKKFGRTQIQLTTYRTLLRRFTQLAENYGVFFADMKSRIEANDIRLSNLESAFEQKIYGVRIAYGSKEAFRRTFEDFSRTAVFELPEESKEAVFLGLYRQACVSFASDGSDVLSSETRKKMKKNVKQSIMNLFESAVMNKMRDYVDVNGERIVNLSVKEALEKELCMLEGYTPDSDDYDDRRIEYEREQIRLAMIEAAPMLAVSSDASNISENVYLAMNPDSAELEAGEVSKSATADRLVPSASAATDYLRPYVLIDEGFSRHEMLCLKARHKYKIDHLVKFAPASEFAELYAERIRNIGQEPTMIGVDAFKTVVTPHLNRYWHEEGFIPALTSEEREEAESKMRKAFVYAMGMDLFALEAEREYNDQPKWKYINISKRRKLVTEKGQVIGTGYSNLFKSLRQNRHLVDSILERALEKCDGERDTLLMTDAPDMVRQLSLLTDLIQFDPEPDDSNLLDILFEMRVSEYMGRDLWTTIFDGLESVLKEYFRRIYGSNLELINSVYQETIDQLYLNSETGKRYQQFNAGQTAALAPIDKEIHEHIMELKAVRILF